MTNVTLTNDLALELDGKEIIVGATLYIVDTSSYKMNGAKVVNEMNVWAYDEVTGENIEEMNETYLVGDSISPMGNEWVQFV